MTVRIVVRAVDGQAAVDAQSARLPPITLIVASGRVIVRAPVNAPVTNMLLVAAAPMYTPENGNAFVPSELLPADVGTGADALYVHEFATGL
jgi:hypothetical protein